jgi:hypothetical protein
MFNSQKTCTSQILDAAWKQLQLMFINFVVSLSTRVLSLHSLCFQDNLLKPSVAWVASSSKPEKKKTYNSLYQKT